MDAFTGQQSMFDEQTPAEQWEINVAKRSLDELFSLARQYRTSEEFGSLLHFIARFRFYSPYNAMLVHVQMPGATYVAPPSRWIEKYGRRIKPAARPLVILQPMGPVMFVFDISDTEPCLNSRKQTSLFDESYEEIPPGIEAPFHVFHGKVGSELESTIENSKRDGVRIQVRKEGSQSAGSIRTVPSAGNKTLLFQTGVDKDKKPTYASIPVRYDILMNESFNREARYATLVHELAHLYSGHLGTPNKKWWPDRRGLSKETVEFEAESVTYLICQRLAIGNPSAQYLSRYFNDNQNVPDISLECIMKVAGLIEQMGRQKLKLRKDKEG